jgi:hypothetical protein
MVDMRARFGQRRGPKISKADIEQHNRLWTAVRFALSGAGKILGYKVPRDFPKQLEARIGTGRPIGSKLDVEKEQDAKGWELFSFADYLYKWTHKLFHAFEESLNYTWETHTLKRDNGDVYLVTVYLDKEQRTRYTAEHKDMNECIIWALHTMTERAIKQHG